MRLHQLWLWQMLLASAVMFIILFRMRHFRFHWIVHVLCVCDVLGIRVHCLIIAQLFLVVVNEYSLTFPSIVSVLSDYVSWLNLSLFSIVNLSCKVAFIDQFDRLKIVTLVPIALTAALGLMHALLRFDVLFEERKRRRWQHLLFTSVLVVMFLVLPSVWVADRPHLRHFASVIVQWLLAKTATATHWLCKCFGVFDCVCHRRRLRSSNPCDASHSTTAPTASSSTTASTATPSATRR